MKILEIQNHFEKEWEKIELTTPHLCFQRPLQISLRNVLKSSTCHNLFVGSKVFSVHTSHSQYEYKIVVSRAGIAFNRFFLRSVRRHNKHDSLVVLLFGSNMSYTFDYSLPNIGACQSHSFSCLDSTSSVATIVVAQVPVQWVPRCLEQLQSATPIWLILQLHSYSSQCLWAYIHSPEVL